MPTEIQPAWPSFALTEVFDVRSGLSKPGSEFGSGFPFVTFKDVLDNYFLPETLGSLVRSSKIEQELCNVRRGDVFLTRTSETQEELGLSSVALRDYEGATFNGFTKRLRPKGAHHVVPEYAAYYLRSPRFRAEMSTFSSLSTRASLNNDMLNRLQIVLPDRKTQEGIGYTLRALDDKIEQNRRTGRSLEELARATFKAWFVDFEPVKAKAAGQTSFPGMPSTVFATLTDRLTDSSLGQVPQGWAVRALSQVCRIVSGGTPKRSEAAYWGGDVPWYSIKDAPPDGEPWVNFTSEHISQAGLDGSAATLVPVGCTIISARGTVGRLGLVARPMAFNQSCYGLLPSDKVSYRHLYLLLREVVDELKQRSHGSVFDTITRQTFDTVNVVLPPPEVLAEFENVTAPWFDLLLALLKESSRLSELRDYLLPRLLSGTSRVKACHV
jgi:type I restriction enzyme S subunit